MNREFAAKSDRESLVHQRTVALAGLARAICVTLVLVAFALRAYHLDFQSFWSDEGISIIRSDQSLGQMWQSMPVEHVPGYFVGLYGWMKLTGQADFSLRFLSLLPSVWAVALVYRLGVSLGSLRAGLVAAALLATSAFQVWYAQEVRMYSWLLATSLLSTWFFWLLLTAPAQRPRLVWAGYVLSTTVTIHLHYFGFLVPVSHSVIMLLWLWRERNWRPFMRWATAGVVVFLLFLPWLVRALALFEFTGWRDPVDPISIPWLLLRAYTVGETMPVPWSEWLPWFYLALALFGSVAWWWRRQEAGLFLVLTLLLSAVAILLLVTRQPDFHVRYTIFISIPLLLLAAGGIVALDNSWWRRYPTQRVPERDGIPSISAHLPTILISVGLLLANAVALHQLYTNTSLHKPNFRSAARAIQQFERPGDIILIDGPNPDLVFDHYYSGSSPVVDMRRLLEAGDAEVDEQLRQITKGANRVWELLYFHPPGPIQVWLATRAWAGTPSYHNNIRVTMYGLAGQPMLEQEMNIAFGPELELISTGVSTDRLRSGDLLHVSTHWWVHEPAPDYRFSLRLQDAIGQVVESRDYVPQNWFAPTNVWLVDRPATDQHALLLPEDLAPGLYRITLRLYDAASGVPVEITAGPDVLLTEIEVYE